MNTIFDMMQGRRDEFDTEAPFVPHGSHPVIFPASLFVKLTPKLLITTA